MKASSKKVSAFILIVFLAVVQIIWGTWKASTYIESSAVDIKHESVVSVSRAFTPYQHKFPCYKGSAFSRNFIELYSIC